MQRPIKIFKEKINFSSYFLRINEVKEKFFNFNFVNFLYQHHVTIDLIKHPLNPELISEAAIQLGESESNVSKALGSLFPAVLGVLPNILNKMMSLTHFLKLHLSISLKIYSKKQENSPEIENIISKILGEQR